MVCTQRVLEARVRRARIDEIRPTELANISQPLKDLRIHERQRQLVDADVVPDGVAQNLEAHRPSLSLGVRQPFGPAFFVAASTVPNFAKFSRNIAASFFAWAS